MRINISEILLTVALSAMMAGGVSCSKADTAGETAAAIVQARINARESARIFLNRPWKDTVELKQKLLEAYDRKEEYARAGRIGCAQAYDTTFYMTLRTVRSDMAMYLNNAIKERRSGAAHPVQEDKGGTGNKK